MSWIPAPQRLERTIAALATLLAAAAAPAQVAFTTLPDPGLHFWESIAKDVSADGSVVVGYAGLADGEGGAVRWSAEGGLQFLEPAMVNGHEVRLAEALGVSADGRVIAGVAINGQVFRWEEGEPTILFGAWSPGNADVSPDGSIIVGTLLNAGGVPFAFNWTAADGFGTFDYTPWDATFKARALCDDGSVVVGYAGTYPTSAPVTWTEADGYSLLSYPSDSASIHGRAYGISADGLVVVGEAEQTRGRSQARWTLGDGGFQWLGELEGRTWSGLATACSADGSVVIGFSDGQEGFSATIWRAGDENVRSIKEMLLTDYGIDLGTRRLASANAISADGHVVCGTSVGPDGFGDAWVLRLDPQAACPCDFDRPNPAITVLDLVAYLDAWFERLAAADYNQDDAIDVFDLLDYLDCWFVANAAGQC